MTYQTPNLLFGDKLIFVQTGRHNSIIPDPEIGKFIPFDSEEVNLLEIVLPLPEY